jgi:hypothetical protein
MTGCWFTPNDPREKIGPLQKAFLAMTGGIVSFLKEMRLALWITSQ